jgi:hypothetical protein
MDYDVYPDAYEYPGGSVLAEPNNWEEVKQILARPRPSLSPSQFSDKEFRKLNERTRMLPKRNRYLNP